MLSSQVRKRRCAICWGPVVLKCIDGDWVVVCPKGCQPGGHVSEDYVEYRRAQDALDAAKVAANYPKLAPAKPAPDEIKAKAAALWPEEEKQCHQ